MFNRQHVRLCCLAFCVGAAFVLILVSLSTFWLIRRHGRAEVLAREQASLDLPKVERWGIIEPIEIPLAHPDGIVPDQAERLQEPRWFFEAYSEQELTRFLKGCNLQRFQRRELMDPASWHIQTNGILLFPPGELIRSLSPQARQQIYSRLALSASNYCQRFPFRFPPNGFEFKLHTAGLAVEQINKIRRLTYTNAGYVCFTDLEAARGILKPAEFKALVQTLYVTPTYFLRVRVTHQMSIEALVQYWGRGGREKRIAPILSSAARVPGGASVNVSYLMPTFARLRLYTYPESWNDPTANRQDCFFTALNFFNETPDTNFFNETYSLETLSSQYQPINDEPVFGDLVTLFDNAGRAVHTCVFIADDFVFTKNGINSSQPWVLMRLPDMLAIYYKSEEHAKISFLRRRNL